MAGFLVGRTRQEVSNAKPPKQTPQAARFAAMPWHGPGQAILKQQAVGSVRGNPSGPPRTSLQVLHLLREIGREGAWMLGFRDRGLGRVHVWVHRNWGLEPVSDPCNRLCDEIGPGGWLARAVPRAQVPFADAIGRGPPLEMQGSILLMSMFRPVTSSGGRTLTSRRSSH